MRVIDYFFYSEEYCHLCLQEKTNGKICNTCKSRIEHLEGKRILKYGDCYYPVFYNNFIKRKIKQFKYEDASYLVHPFVEILYDYIKRIELNFDYISSVPMYKKDEYQRGYNQADLLAKELATLTGKKYVDIAIKSKSTKHQNKLKKKDRIHNLDLAFESRKDLDLENKRVLIIDDLVTTGSTLNNLSEAIHKEMQVDLVYLCLASSKID